jgi:mannose-6-phosphate isomerase-like protein (cupin superfamily)
MEEAVMATPIGGTVKSFGKPDDRITKGGAEIEVVQIGDMKVKRITYPPGWRFSTHMGAPKCMDTHVGYTLSGHMVAELDNGTRLEFGPGSVFVIPAGHDGWVAGDEQAVIVQFDEGESAAQRFNVASPGTKAA